MDYMATLSVPLSTTHHAASASTVARSNQPLLGGGDAFGREQPSMSRAANPPRVGAYEYQDMYLQPVLPSPPASIKRSDSLNFSHLATNTSSQSLQTQPAALTAQQTHHYQQQQQQQQQQQYQMQQAYHHPLEHTATQPSHTLPAEVRHSPRGPPPTSPQYRISSLEVPIPQPQSLFHQPPTSPHSYRAFDATRYDLAPPGHSGYGYDEKGHPAPWPPSAVPTPSDLVHEQAALQEQQRILHWERMKLQEEKQRLAEKIRAQGGQVDPDLRIDDPDDLNFTAPTSPLRNARPTRSQSKGNPSGGVDFSYLDDLLAGKPFTPRGSATRAHPQQQQQQPRGKPVRPASRSNTISGQSSQHRIKNSDSLNFTLSEGDDLAAIAPQHQHASRHSHPARQTHSAYTTRHLAVPTPSSYHGHGARTLSRPQSAASSHSRTSARSMPIAANPRTRPPFKRPTLTIPPASASPRGNTMKSEQLSSLSPHLGARSPRERQQQLQQPKIYSEWVTDRLIESTELPDTLAPSSPRQVDLDRVAARAAEFLEAEAMSQYAHTVSVEPSQPPPEKPLGERDARSREYAARALQALKKNTEVVYCLEVFINYFENVTMKIKSPAVAFRLLDFPSIMVYSPEALRRADVGFPSFFLACSCELMRFLLSLASTSSAPT